MQENTPTVEQTKRDILRERLRTKYPDKSFDDDDEALYGQINDDYDNYESELTKHREQAQQFSDMFSSDPRSASFLQHWRNGEDPALALVRLYGEDIKAVLEDPERLEEVAEAHKEYLGRIEQNRELEEQYQQNMQATLSALEQLQAERGLSDDEIDEAMQFLLEIVGNGIVGKFTPESIELALKALNHDTNVENARHEGNIQGRNTKIEEKLRKPSQGDGIPHLGGAGTPPPAEAPRRRSVFSMAKEAR